MRERLKGRPIRYLIVGGWNTVFGLGFFSLLYLVLGKTLGYLGVLTIAQVVAVMQSHLTQRVAVWRSHAPYLHELLRFSAVYVGSYVANLLLLAVAVDALGLPVLPSQWVIGLSLLVPTFLVSRAWTFRVGPASASATPPAELQA